MKYKNLQGNVYSGSLDQQTYASWKGINYVKTRQQTMYNPTSYKQALIRAKLEQLAKAWDGISGANKSLWENLGIVSGPPNPETGQRAIIRCRTTPCSGINAYIEYNLRAFVAGQPLPFDLPAGHTPPVINSGIVATWSIGHELTIVWVDENPTGLTTVMEIWGLGTTTNHGNKIVRKQLLGHAMSSIETITIAGYSGANGVPAVFADIIGVKMLYQCVVVDTVNGYMSAPSVTGHTTVA